MAQLAQLLDHTSIERLASARSFALGRDYADKGAVGRLEIADERVEATVQGREAYWVRLAPGDTGLEFSCSCPVRADDAFCKHCVAVALCWLEESAPGGPTLDDVRDHLRALGTDKLVDLLTEHARDDQRLARRLRTMTLRSAEGPVDIAAYRSLIDRAFAVHGFVSWREAYDYFSGVEEAVDAVGELLVDGHAAAVVGLAEHALAGLEAAIEQIDDSGGGTREVIERVEALHHAACLIAMPDPVELAERLVDWELRSQWEVFYRAVTRYADVLGPTGLERYRALAERRWEKVPALGPGDEDPNRYGGRLRLTFLMEALAELSGDVEQVVSVRSRDLSGPHDFLNIAELYGRQGNADAALEWAERGLRAFPDRGDPRLRAFVAEEYRRRGRDSEALELAWLTFRDHPVLESYRRLKADAERLGEWPERREAAQGHLLQRSEPVAGAVAGQRWPLQRDRSELVRILLWEGEDEAAWTHASTGGCSDPTWLELAARRRPTHPADALAVYEREVENVIEGRSNESYRAAVELMGEVRGVLGDLGSSDAFPAYVARVRERHKRKRNLVKLLDSVA